jgi:2-polyprenyl-6-methoxyphenol hydroxylase-like FAD-dependent oxidoreductase
LARRFVERGGTLLRGHALVAVSHTEHGVEITTDTGRTLRADYLVACDGAHSTVRTVLDVPFPGKAATTVSTVADVRLAARSPEVPDSVRHFSEHMRMANGYWAVLAPLEEGLYRFMFGSTAGRRTSREAPVTTEEVRVALQAVYGPETDLAEVRAASRFSDASRLVDDYRLGRVFFAGDAAHIHLPVGGQGVNLGIQDAANLGWKLAAQVGGSAPAGLLDTYHAERHPVAARVLRNTRAQAVLLNSGGNEDVAALRAIVVELMRLPQANRYLSGMISGLDTCYERAEDDHPLVGYRMPDLDLVTEDGATRLSALTHDGRGLLLRFDSPGLPSLRGWDERVRSVWATSTTADLAVDTVLVRPDGHVAWAGPSADTPGLGQSLARWFGAPAV